MKKYKTNEPVREDNKAALKLFMVALEATSYKEIPIQTHSKSEAMDLVRDMYFKTDAIEFTDDDVESVTASAYDEDAADIDDEVATRKLEVMTQLVRTIRTVDLPDVVIAHMMVELFDSLTDEASD